MKMNKLNVAAGIEWIIIFPTLTVLLCMMLGISYSYILKSEMRKLAFIISNSIKINEPLSKACSNIEKEDFKKIHYKLSKLYEQHGSNLKPYIEASSYLKKYNLIIKIDDKISLLLDDNVFYDDEMRIAVSFDDNVLNLSPLKELKFFIYKDIQKKIIFVPELKKDIIPLSKLDKKNFLNNQKIFKDFCNGERKVIDESTTKEILEKVLKKYNEMSSRKFQIDFNTLNGCKSFFFYNIEDNNLRYFVKSCYELDKKEDNIYFFPDSLHLVIFYNIYIPFAGNKIIKYVTDVNFKNIDIKVE